MDNELEVFGPEGREEAQQEKVPSFSLSQHFLFHDLKPGEVRHGDHLRVARFIGAYFHHGYAINYGSIKQYINPINMMRASRAKPPLDMYYNDAILIVEQNRDPDGLCVVTIDEFSQGATLRIVKYNVGAAEFTLKMSGSTYTQPALQVEVSTARAVEELMEQYKLEHVDQKETHWQYHLAARNCETFVLYCKGVIEQEDQFSGQVSYALALGTSVSSLTVKEGVTSPPKVIAHLKKVSIHLYHFAKSIFTKKSHHFTTTIVTKGVKHICTHFMRILGSSAIGAAFQLIIEVAVILVRWLLNLWDKNHWFAITTKTFLQEILKAVSRSFFSFVGCILGTLSGVFAGPLAIVTGVLGSIIGNFMGNSFLTALLAWREKQAQEETPLLAESSEGVKEEDKKVLEITEHKGEGEGTQFVIRDLQEDEIIRVKVGPEAWLLM